MLVEFVVRLEFSVDVVPVEQDTAGPGVLGKDQVGLFQNLRRLLRMPYRNYI